MFERLRAPLFSFLDGKVFYSWVILAVTSLIMFGTGPGQSHLIGLFFDPIAQELGLSRTSMALAYGIATLFAAGLLPQLGKLVDRHGPANMLWGIAACFGLACILFSFAAGWLYLVVGFAFLRFLGQGAIIVNCANMVSHWFRRRRGLALGLMALGFPLSIALHPPLVQAMIEWVGWRQTWVWLGLATWVMLLPPILLLLYSRPEDVGLRPDGIDGREGDSDQAALGGLSLAEALRTPAFYIIAAGLFSLSMLVTSLHVENKGILMRHGLDAQTAANMFAVTGLVAAVTMPLVGWMLDRVATRAMFIGGLLVMVATLWSVTFVTELAGAVGYAILFGLNNAITMTYFSFMWPRYFGLRHLGAIQGTGTMIAVVGASLGPLPLGIAVDLLGDYDSVLRLLALFPAACALLVLFLRAPGGAQNRAD